MTQEEINDLLERPQPTCASTRPQRIPGDPEGYEAVFVDGDTCHGCCFEGRGSCPVKFPCEKYRRPEGIGIIYRSTKSMSAIFAASDEYELAAKRIIDVVKREIPVGTVLRATVGNSRPTFRVLEHSSSWWSRPGEITVQNVETLKTRRISAINPMLCIEVVEPSK